ncbi:hypothetical protein GGI19_005120 [Coemansia pectinata]|uniref:Myb-like domain-containing protein n=1 Tax=Coemansia pectinata TaxID=1052879 RepID=A0A9W8L8R6_9FUNG|nr:hypothetical protein GGI19_005120 [Coemansia pectinata]
MGKRFRYWHVETSWFRDVNYVEAATCVLLLALICPNFDYAAVDKFNRKPFMRAMQKKIVEPGHSPAGPSADIQKAIVEEVRLFRQVDKSIPWYPLAAKYRLSVDAVQTIYNQAEVDARRRQKQSVLVTRAAERHFDSSLDQCNWEAVVSELDTPLIECLDLFDASNSTIQPRSLIETYGGWSTTDMERLRQFIADNYTDDSTVDWKLAGAYMNVDSLECRRVGLHTFNEPINTVGYRRICELRESKLSWKEIHQCFLQYSNESLLCSRYQCFKAKLKGKTAKRLTAKWTDSEHKQMMDLINRHVQSASRSELVDIIKCVLPARPLSDIRIFFDRYAYELKTGRLRLDQIARLRELVAEYGEDWDRIGEALGVLPSRAQHNWIKYGGNVDDHSAWSVDEIRQLQRLVESGVKSQEAAQLMVIKPHWACEVKARTVKSSAKQKRGDALSGLSWAAADDETLLKMVDGPGANTTARWEQVGKDLGRTVAACRARFSVLNRSRSAKQLIDNRKPLVSSVVQGQLELNGAVDWLQVSQSTGLGLRECLELSQYDVGKASWQYDPDSFSQSMADRMAGFIKEHYPAPALVNYRAVSNFMWVYMDDCVRIHDMLQGKFKWTEAGYERAAALKAQGLTFKEVAQHLSPSLTLRSIANALGRYSSPKRVREPISVDRLEEINRLVDEYAGKFTVIEIVNKIRTTLNLDYRCNYHSKICWRMSVHPYYLAKSRNIDYNDVANRIATGQTTATLAAKELDIPLPTLVSKVRNVNSKLYSPKWTEEEIRRLVDYVQTCDSKPDMVFFSRLIGTKSSMQCNTKVFHLRRKGILPSIGDMVE